MPTEADSDVIVYVVWGVWHNTIAAVCATEAAAKKHVAADPGRMIEIYITE